MFSKCCPNYMACMERGLKSWGGGGRERAGKNRIHTYLCEISHGTKLIAIVDYLNMFTLSVLFPSFFFFFFFFFFLALDWPITMRSQAEDENFPASDFTSQVRHLKKKKKKKKKKR